MDAQARRLWEEVLKTPDLRLVGGEIEFLEGGEEFLGPVSEVRLIESGLFIRMDWVARLELDEDDEQRWFYAPDEDDFLMVTAPPEVRSGTVQFALPRGCGWILPVGAPHTPRDEIIRLAA